MTEGSTATRPWLCPIDGDTALYPETGGRCPVKKSHDTYSARRYGCESGAAVEDYRIYMKRLREGRNQPRLVDPTGVVRRIEACHYMGHTGADIGRALGVSFSAVSKQRRRTRPLITIGLRDRMIPALDRLAMRQAPRNPEHNKTRNWARRQGFRPLLAWNDIDDPNETPPPPVDPSEQIVELAARGLTQARIAAKLDVSEWSVRQALKDREVVVELDPHLIDAVLDRRRRFDELSEPEARVVVAKLWDQYRTAGYDKPGHEIADRLGTDFFTVDRIHDTNRSAAWRNKRGSR
jgi:predicted transcriptional regulator